MANADQILSLIRNHLNNDDAQFRKVALQIAAVEAKNGHGYDDNFVETPAGKKKRLEDNQPTLFDGMEDW